MIVPPFIFLVHVVSDCASLAAHNTAAYDPNAPASSFRTLSASTLRYRRKASRASRDFLKPNGNDAAQSS